LNGKSRESNQQAFFFGLTTTIKTKETTSKNKEKIIITLSQTNHIFIIFHSSCSGRLHLMSSPSIPHNAVF